MHQRSILRREGCRRFNGCRSRSSTASTTSAATVTRRGGAFGGWVVRWPRGRRESREMVKRPTTLTFRQRRFHPVPTSHILNRWRKFRKTGWVLNKRWMILAYLGRRWTVGMGRARLIIWCRGWTMSIWKENGILISFELSLTHFEEVLKSLPWKSSTRGWGPAG